LENEILGQGGNSFHEIKKHLVFPDLEISSAVSNAGKGAPTSELKLNETRAQIQNESFRPGMVTSFMWRKMMFKPYDGRWTFFQ